jgi:hypothetical protein
MSTDDQYWFRVTIMEFHIPTINPHRETARLTFKPKTAPTLQDILDIMHRHHPTPFATASLIKIEQGNMSEYGFYSYCEWPVPLTAGKVDEDKLAQMLEYETKQEGFYKMLDQRHTFANMLTKTH